MIGLLVLFVFCYPRALDDWTARFICPRALDYWTARFICFIIREL